MDRKVLYLVILIIILSLPYFWLKEDAFGVCLSIVAIIIFVPLLWMFRDFTTRKLNFDKFSLIVSNDYMGQKKDWEISEYTKRLESINKEITVVSYDISKTTKFHTVDIKQKGLTQYQSYGTGSHSDIMKLYYIEFDNEKENEMCKDELLEEFNVSVDKYKSFKNRCIILSYGTGIVDVKFK